ncbi:MAG: DUF1893 domain-containing protein [Clostridia bacterium]|nr:DUF1893 domain-containing protein [Clostridia bacterium]
MKSDTKKALEILRREELTCAVCRGDEVYKSQRRGVAPLLNWLDNGMRFSGFCAADKVVGAGAAYLYVLLGVEELFATVVSDSARRVLQQHGIALHYETLVPYIVNRAGDGTCPIESAVAEATDPVDALTRIRRRLVELKA